jgi:hypothetical protein
MTPICPHSLSGHGRYVVMSSGVLTEEAVHHTKHEVHATDDGSRDVVVVVWIAAACHCCGGHPAAGEPAARHVRLRPCRGQQRPRLQTRHRLPDTQCYRGLARENIQGDSEFPVNLL